ncbi:polysaccharide biosynthesis/export family protein [Fervidobacterium sp.]
MKRLPFVFSTLLLLLASMLFGNYTIKPGDTISIQVVGEPTLSVMATVLEDGTMSYPYAGIIKVSGLTTEQVRALVESHLRKILKSPVVVVNIIRQVESLPQYIYVSGIVSKAVDISLLQIQGQSITLSKLFAYLNITPKEADLGNVVVIRGGKPQTYNMLPFFYEGNISNDTTLNVGDVVVIPPLTSAKYVHVSGAYSVVKNYEPGMTLRNLLSILGPIDELKADIENSLLITSNLQTNVNLRDVLTGKLNYSLSPGAYLYIPLRTERFVYVVGFVEKPGVANFQPFEPLTLSYALAKVGGITKDSEKWIEKIVITTPDGKRQEHTVSVLSVADTVNLVPGTIVNVVKYPEFRVYVNSDFITSNAVAQTSSGNQSIVQFEPDEHKTLSMLLTKMGGLKTEQMKWVESIKINGKAIDLSKIDTYNLSNGDSVEIKKFSEFKVYVNSDFLQSDKTSDFTNLSVVQFEPDEPKTLRMLLTKIGGLKTDQLKWIESIKINDKAIDLTKIDSYTLKNNDSVEIKKYPEFYVYVQGYANTKGKILFEPQEPKTLKTLINKIGVASPDVENEGIAIINNTTSMELRDIVYSNKDIPLSLGDNIIISYEPFIVYVSGSGMPGVVQLSYYEPKTLSYIFKKLVSTPENIEQVTLVRDGKETVYSPNDLLYGLKDSVIERNDTVVFKQADVNAVYLIGDVSSYVSFALNEPITIQRILAKVGLSDLRRIESITLDGTNVNFTTDISIPKGSILKVQLKKPVFVTAMGYIRNTGRVQFDYYETPDLKTLFAKLGGLIVGPENYYASDKVLIIREGKLVGQFDAENIFKGIENAELKDGDFVYVTQKDPNQVYVFGKGVPNGLYKFAQGEEFDLRTLIGKLGGIKEGVSRNLTIVSGDKVESIKWDEYTNFKLASNSIILFDVDKENYVYIIRQDGRPDMIYTDKPTTLYEILTKIGIDKNYRKIELTRGTEKQTLELKDLAQARGYNVYPGDVVKVLDVPQNFAYVLGEVNRPGIVQLTEGTTVLQAVIQAGYFTAKAAPSTVWVYKGGIDGKVEKVNLSGAISGGRVENNIILESGDIVFVPSDPFKSALEWIPVINNLITFYNNVSGLFK